MMNNASILMGTQSLSRFAVVPLLVLTLGASACGSDPTDPTPLAPVQSLEVYSGPLDPGGVSTYLFTLGTTSTVQLMLAGAVLDAPLRSFSPVLHLEIATWTGSECQTLVQTDTQPRLTAALHAYLEAGTYCAKVSDLGALTEAVGTTLRIVAPVLIKSGGQPGTETFSSTITPAGSAVRTIQASEAGTVAITLTGLSAAGEAGLGLGVPATDGSGCKYSQIVRAMPGDSPQITTRVDAGPYCVSIFDAGNFTRNESFSMTIAHP